MRWLAWLAILFAPCVYAQVVTCSDAVTGQPYAACAHLSSTTAPSSGQLELFCSGAVGGGALDATLASCAANQWQADSWMQSYSWIWTQQGWQRHGSLTFPTTPPAPTPAPPTDTTASGNVLVSWVAPVPNAATITGYTIDYGLSAATLDHQLALGGARTTSYQFQNLAAGTWYFVVRAVTSAGVSSDASNLASKTIAATPPPIPTPSVTWAVAPITTNSRPVYEAVLNAAGNATVRGNTEGQVASGKPCGPEAFKVSTNSYREVAETDITLDSPTYRGRRHTAICVKQ